MKQDRATTKKQPTKQKKKTKKPKPYKPNAKNLQPENKTFQFIGILFLNFFLPGLKQLHSHVGTTSLQLFPNETITCWK